MRGVVVRLFFVIIIYFFYDNKWQTNFGDGKTLENYF